MVFGVVCGVLLCVVCVKGRRDWVLGYSFPPLSPLRERRNGMLTLSFFVPTTPQRHWTDGETAKTTDDGRADGGAGGGDGARDLAGQGD